MTEPAPDTADALVVERFIAARPETVFAYLTEPGRYTRWMGSEARLDARPGGIYEVRTTMGDVARGEFVEVEPPRRVVFTWGWEGSDAVPPGSSRVEITIEERDGGSLLRLRHTGLPEPAIGQHREGWQYYTQRLEAVGEDRDPGPDDPSEG